MHSYWRIYFHCIVWFWAKSKYFQTDFKLFWKGFEKKTKEKKRKKKLSSCFPARRPDFFPRSPALHLSLARPSNGPSRGPKPSSPGASSPPLTFSLSGRWAPPVGVSPLSSFHWPVDPLSASFIPYLLPYPGRTPNRRKISLPIPNSPGSLPYAHDSTPIKPLLNACDPFFLLFHAKKPSSPASASRWVSPKSTGSRRRGAPLTRSCCRIWAVAELHNLVTKLPILFPSTLPVSVLLRWSPNLQQTPPPRFCVAYLTRDRPSTGNPLGEFPLPLPCSQYFSHRKPRPESYFDRTPASSTLFRPWRRRSGRRRFPLPPPASNLSHRIEIQRPKTKLTSSAGIFVKESSGKFDFQPAVHDAHKKIRFAMLKT